MNNFPTIDIDSTFIRAVRSYSFISKSEGAISDEDIRTIAINDAYPRVLTRIALTTDKSGIPIFGGIGNSKDYGIQYLKSLEVMNTPPYSLGLKRVTIALTASALIRFIPLKSDITLVDIAESIEKGALEDLDKLTGILSNDPKTLETLRKSEPSQATTYKALFFSQDIDESTIPIEAFTKILDTVAFYKGAKIYQRAEVPKGHIGICVITLSCQIKQSLLRDSFVIENGQSATDIATNITQVINELNIELGTGIIASVNKGSPELIKIPVSPSRLYPTSNLDNNLQLFIELTPSIDTIEIVSQVSSPLRDKEVLMVDLYTVPLSSTTNLTNQDLIKLTRQGTRGIKGIIYGTIGKYTELTNKGPHSTIVEIDKGTLLTKQEQDLVNPGESILNLKNNLVLDTFHFRLTKNYSTLSPSQVSIRISTQPATQELNAWTYAFNGGSIEDLVTGLLDSIFTYSRPTCLVGALTSPLALQMVPHLITDDETRIVIDLINLPIGVEVSTGTDRLHITPFKEGTRSINVPAIRISSGELNQRLNNVIKTSPTNATINPIKSPAQSGVSDKLLSVREKLRSYEGCGSNQPNRLNPGCTNNYQTQYYSQHIYTLNDVIDIYINGQHL